MRRLLVAAAMLALAGAAAAKDYDLAINNGRVIDPETGLDAARSVGVSDGAIAKISKKPLKARVAIDATGKVVAPGFIDRNTYTLGDGLFRSRAADGVTTTFNFEQGAVDIDAAYAALEGKALINFGFSVSHLNLRMAATGDPNSKLANGVDNGFPASEIARRSLTNEEQARLLALLEAELEKGAPAIGVGLEYLPGATNSEIFAVFELAAKYGRGVQIHLREWNDVTDHQEIYEIIAAAAITGGAIHASHMNASANIYIDRYPAFVARAAANGVAVSTECYPYTAGMTGIESALFDDWETWQEERFARFMWPQTGETLTRKTFGKYRKQGGMVILEFMQEAWIEACIASPLTQIASDGGWDEGKTHPRVAGTNTRVLGRYVREKKLLSLNDAIAKMTILPAKSLQGAAPRMAKKGRLQEGMDADIVVFDPETVIDRATYQEPVLAPSGVDAVIVNGVAVLRDGTFADDVFPGEAIRAPEVKP